MSKYKLSDILMSQNNKEGTKMGKFIHDKKNGLDYELVGDYYIPCLKAPEAPKIINSNEYFLY